MSIKGIPTMDEHIKSIRQMNRETVESTSFLRKCAMCRHKSVHRDKMYCDDCLYYGIPEGL